MQTPGSTSRKLVRFNLTDDGPEDDRETPRRNARKVTPKRISKRRMTSM